MDQFYERLVLRAATFDELLSDDFETLPGQKGDADLATRRLASWCRSCASGDWSLFARRLERDRLTLADVLARFATSRRRISKKLPLWAEDAAWILQALETPPDLTPPAEQISPVAFETLLRPLIEKATAFMRSNITQKAASNLGPSAYVCLQEALFAQLSELVTPALYERFCHLRKAAEEDQTQDKSKNKIPTFLYERFREIMASGGFRQLFEQKPVLLRLLATLIRQWIDTSQELIARLDTDLTLIRKELNVGIRSQVKAIEVGLADPHNLGHSVKIIIFADNSKVVYKPKDLRIDAAWQKLIHRLNKTNPPIDLRIARALARDGYGWTEFVSHRGCGTSDECSTFFKRAGAWLALFHVFAANDMHQENIIATTSYPVPIDLETILQSSRDDKSSAEPEEAAFDTAMEKLADSVMAVGLLPAYGRGPDGKIFAMGGMTADWNAKIKIRWENINTDIMRPTKWKETIDSNPNLPHFDGRYENFVDRIDELVSGFDSFARFIMRERDDARGVRPFADFSGIPVRRVFRATRFYAMLLQRLKNHKTMEDGVMWSVQADFIARLADWEADSDPLWALQASERAALLALNIPHFSSKSDDNEIFDFAGLSLRTHSVNGLVRARQRLDRLDEDEIKWQIEVIRVNASSLTNRGDSRAQSAPSELNLQKSPFTSEKSIFRVEAERIADDISRQAIRVGPAASWIGIDWLGDADVFQLVALGPDLYNGTAGISVFLAAYAAKTGQPSFGDLALAGVARIRKQLKNRTAARAVRALGIGGATGLGSVIYALSVMSQILRDGALLEDAHRAAELITDDLIGADNRLDLIAGSAGAIVCLLRLYRDARSKTILRTAIRCGEHLLSQKRLGQPGLQSWVGQGLGTRALNGMSHGASGFAYALASLSAMTGREDFMKAALECLEFENSNFESEQNNWPDLRSPDGKAWPCQWCHGAPGIGLARIAISRLPQMNEVALKEDISNAVQGTLSAAPSTVDTLCCGSLGRLEFLFEAGHALESKHLCELASRRLASVIEQAKDIGDYKWNSGTRKFNLGLFRGLAGVGYSALRQIDPGLPNVLIFE